MCEPPRHSGSATFLTTHWTRVLEARGNTVEAKAALSELCAAYYAPVFAFIRHNAPDEETARDLTQEFFARLLAGHGVDKVERERGRFRSYLLGAVKHFLADIRDRDHRLKRGAGQPVEVIGFATDTSTGLEVSDPKAPSPEHEFDRKWALTVLDRALTALAQEHKTSAKSELFEALRPWLTGDTENLSQADAALRLGMNENAVKVAIHRLRKRFRELVKAEIGHTLNNPAQVADELSCLTAALGG
jgi:RNA polymerase sigma factor (sigma-70 family)